MGKRLADKRDAQERRARNGAALPSSYRSLIGEAPRCGAGDTDKAAAFVARIDNAIARGRWSSYECSRLHKLRDKWARRASGKDQRFNWAGTRRGRLDAIGEKAVELRRCIEQMRLLSLLDEDVL